MSDMPIIKLASDVHMVGGGYSVRFTAFSDDNADAILLKVEWSPNVPTGADLLGKVDPEKYAAAASQFAIDVDSHFGGSHG